jgi:uncharacterized membrane protein
MKPQRRTGVGIALTVLTAVAGFVFVDQLPTQVAIQFGAGGQPNSYASKTVAVGLVPAVQLALLGIFTLVPRIDPLRENIEAFQRAYDIFVVLVIGFLGYVHALVILWNIGYNFGITQALIPANAALYYAVGELTQRAEQNWFIGIRTPWTLSSEEVWENTHDLGGKLMKAAAAVTLGGLFFPSAAVLFLTVPFTVVAVFATLYSYWDYQRLRDYR